MPAQKGKSKPEYTPEQKAKIVERVCSLYETQNATVASCCEMAGISDRLFNLWVAQSSEFSERYKKAKERQDKNYWENIIRPLAKTTLQRLLEGEEITDTELRDLSDKGKLTGDKAQIVKTGRTQPNATALIFALKGLYPEMFADRAFLNVKTEAMEPQAITPEMIAQIDRLLSGEQTTDDEGATLPGKRKGQR